MKENGFGTQDGENQSTEKAKKEIACHRRANVSIQ